VESSIHNSLKNQKIKYLILIIINSKFKIY
jgi:hypothetical protein